MNLIRWAENLIKKLNIYDIAILKIYVALIGIIIGAYAAGWVKNNILILILIVVVLFIYLFGKFIRK